jgi:hypothetical protein
LTQNTEDCTSTQNLNPASYDTIEDSIQAEVDDIEGFRERLYQNVNKICDFTVIDGISRSGQHPLLNEPKSIVICIYLYEDVAVQDTIKVIKETAKQTHLNRKINLYKCDCLGRDGHGAWTLSGGLEAGAGAVITHAVGQPYNHGCVCGNQSWARWHNGWDAMAGL